MTMCKWPRCHSALSHFVLFLLVCFAVFEVSALRLRRRCRGGLAVWLGCARDLGFALFRIFIAWCCRVFSFLCLTHLHDLDEITVCQLLGALGQPRFLSFRVAQIRLHALFVSPHLFFFILQSQYLLSQLICFSCALCDRHRYGCSVGGSCAAAGGGGRHVYGNNLRARGMAAKACVVDPDAAVGVSVLACSVSSTPSPGSASWPADRVRLDVLLRRPAHTKPVRE